VRARSRGRGIGAIGADATFTPTATPTCPPGQHWEAPAANTVQGLAACVPNQTVHLTLRPAPTTAAAAPAPTTPTTAAAAPAPATVTTASCPTPWSLWWLLAAAAAGAVAGRYVAQNQKKVKKNAGRIVNAAGGRLVDHGMSRLLG
jgi:hypothetical protein